MKSAQVPIVGHPTRTVFVSERKARKLLESRKAQMIDGVLYWFKVPRRQLTPAIPRLTWFDRELRERPLKKYAIAQSGYAGPLVLQGVSQ